MSAVVGTIQSIHRFPVKSMRGETLRRAVVEPAGLVGDREWALLDPLRNWASAKTNRERWRLVDGMLDLRAGTIDDDPGSVVVTLPDGRTAVAGEPGADALLSAHLGRELRFDRGDRGSGTGRHHDAASLHLVTTATLGALRGDDGTPLHPMRLRPNLVVATPDGVAGFPEDGWVGQKLRVGSAVLRVTEATERCVMTTRAQADELPRAPTVLKRIGAANHACAGVYLAVVEAGIVTVGDDLRTVD